MNDSIRLGNIEITGSPEREERRDAAANRALLLATAESLFAQHGVANVNMADIAQAAGVGKGTLYRRFANKAELALALLDTQMHEFQEETLSRLRQQVEQEMPKLEQLDQFLDDLVYFVDRHNPLLCVVQREGLLEGMEEQDLQQPHFWQHMTIGGLLQGAIDEGDLPADLDVAYTADALLAALNASLFRFQRQGREFSLERISEGLRRLAAGLRFQPNR
jgi:AcrR family transcriptional regulator